MATNVQGIVQPPKVTEPVDPYAATGVPVAPKPPAPIPPSINTQPPMTTGGPDPYTPPTTGGIQNTAPTGGGTIIGSVPSPVQDTPATTAPNPTATPSTTTPATPPAAPPAVTGSLPTGVGTTGFGPGNTLIGQQITTAGDPSRIDLAKQYFDQMSQATDPAYAASLRKATQVAAANGGLGSGQLNTTYGDLALQRAQNLDLLQKGLLTNAEQGTIQDNLNNANQARTERQYQNDLQTQALQQRLQQLMLEQQIGGNQASYLGSYNANPNIAASQSYGKTTTDQSNALQQMLAASQQLSGLIPSSPPPPPTSMPNIPDYTFDPVTGQIILPGGG